MFLQYGRPKGSVNKDGPKKKATKTTTKLSKKKNQASSSQSTAIQYEVEPKEDAYHVGEHVTQAYIEQNNNLAEYCQLDPEELATMLNDDDFGDNFILDI